MTKPIKTLFFDLGNVLIFFSYEKMMDQISKCTGLSKSHISRLLFENQLQSRFELGEINTRFVYQTFQQVAPQPCTFEEFSQAASDIFSPNLPMWNIAEKLKQQNCQLILLSNTNECHYQRALTLYPVLDLFEKKVLSFEVNALKPDPAIYHAALKIAGCPAEECFYIDDLPENIAAAKKLNIEGVVYSDMPSFEVCLRQKNILNEPISSSKKIES